MRVRERLQRMDLGVIWRSVKALCAAVFYSPERKRWMLGATPIDGARPLLLLWRREKKRWCWGWMMCCNGLWCDDVQLGEGDAVGCQTLADLCLGEPCLLKRDQDNWLLAVRWWKGVNALRIEAFSPQQGPWMGYTELYDSVEFQRLIQFTYYTHLPPLILVKKRTGAIIGLVAFFFKLSLSYCITCCLLSVWSRSVLWGLVPWLNSVVGV